MKKIERITEFVSDLFELYHMNTYGFFEDYDEETEETVEVPLFRYGEIDDETIYKLCVNFGLTKEEILSLDEDAAKKYWNKYPFFRLYRDFMSSWAWQSRFKSERPSPEELLLRKLFETEDELAVEERYDYPAVKERMIQKLKEIDVVMPGTYHTDADITKLSINTEVFISFPQCQEMLRSFIDMVNRVKELFFKALTTDLTAEEANEYNFLASWLWMCDVATPSTTLTYDNVLIYREVFVKEGYTDLFSYAKFKRFIGTAPWRCKEFFDDMELAQEIVNIYPQAKAEMRQFAMDVTKFSCEFVWSDAKPIMYSPEEEAELSAINAMFGEEDIPLEQRAKERTHIYVEKTSEEMFDWEDCARKLRDAASPPSKGGLELPVREAHIIVGSVETFARIQARVAARHGGNN